MITMTEVTIASKERFNVCLSALKNNLFMKRKNIQYFLTSHVIIHLIAAYDN